MTSLALAPDAPPATEHPPHLVPRIASLRLDVPATLPETNRGEPLRQLSYSGISRFRGCPDDFRRCYLLNEWGATTGDQFVGSRVDDAISGYFRAVLAGTTLDTEAIIDLYNELWKSELANELSRNGPVRFSTRRTREQTHGLGIEAVVMAMKHIVPHLGRPIAVQRRFEFKLHPNLAWAVAGKADLDTIREQTLYLKDDGTIHPAIREHGYPEPVIALPYKDAPAAWRQPVPRGKDTLEPREAIATFERDTADYQDRLERWTAGGEDGAAPKPPKPLPDVNIPVSELTVTAVRQEVAGVTDLKFTGRVVYEKGAREELQASMYLTERWLAGDPAFDFRYAQIHKPGSGNRVNMGHSIVATTRTDAEMRVTLMRIAQTANLIWAAYRRFGRDKPWGWASEEWRCRNCTHGPLGSAKCPFKVRAAA